MQKLENKHILVTGGTSGIGLAAARVFLDLGATVTVTGSSARSVEAARAELGAEVVVSDAASSESIQALAQRFAGGLDGLFLNAGIAKFGPLTELDEATFDASFALNVRGTWLMLKHFAPRLRDGGSIVVNGSINASLGMPGSGLYAATKAAVVALVRVAATELAPRGIRVNSVSPGPVATPLYDKLGLTKEQQSGFQAGLAERIPLKRFGRPDEIGQTVAFLLSAESSFITGEDLVIDGGLTRV